MRKIKFFIYFLISTVFSSEQTVFIIPINGDIDMGLPYVVNRGIDQAENNDAKLIIFDIDTFGGRVDAATKNKR